MTSAGGSVPGQPGISAHPLKPSAKIAEFCRCPEFVSRDEWLASHGTFIYMDCATYTIYIYIVVFDLYQLTKDYASLFKTCPCARMVVSGEGDVAMWPPSSTTLFAAPSSVGTFTSTTSQQPPAPESLFASKYIDLGLSWLEHVIDDQKCFPTKSSLAFPHDFVDNVAYPCLLIISNLILHQYSVHEQEHVDGLHMAVHLSTLVMHIEAIRREYQFPPIPGLQPLLQNYK
jgi:hypothetical protein